MHWLKVELLKVDFSTFHNLICLHGMAQVRLAHFSSLFQAKKKNEEEEDRSEILFSWKIY